MKKALTTIILVLLVLSSCEDRDDSLFAPNIRIQNLSDRNFQRVEIRVDSFAFENITAGSFSEYLEFNPAYRADTIRVEADSIQSVFIPDSLGAPLPKGLYTYQLNVNTAGELELTFKLD